jgi:hypothetical protein
MYLHFPISLYRVHRTNFTLCISVPDTVSVGKILDCRNPRIVATNPVQGTIFCLSFNLVRVDKMPSEPWSLTLHPGMNNSILQHFCGVAHTKFGSDTYFKMHIGAFCVTTATSVDGGHKSFGRVYCLHLQCKTECSDSIFLCNVTTSLPIKHQVSWLYTHLNKVMRFLRVREGKASWLAGSRQPYSILLQIYEWIFRSKGSEILTFQSLELTYSYIPPALTYRNSLFYPQYIYIFCVDLKTLSDYFSLQH